MNKKRKEKRQDREREKEKEKRRKRGLLHSSPPYTGATRASKYKGARGSDASPRLYVRILRQILFRCATLQLVGFTDEAAKFSSL